MGKSWEIFIAKCVLAGIPVYDVKSIMESLTGRVDIEHLSENSFGSVLPSSLYLRMQRGLDLCLALVLLPFFIVAILVAGLFIKFETGGPVFYTQPRMGFRARIFTIYKLRSMRDGVATGKIYTEENDPRITKVGRFIRKYRIDEFPQILNIIKGEMSWIGPRPEAVELADWYANDIPFYIYRHAVRPGLSGWAQVMQGNVAKVDAATIKLQFDFYYIKHFSPWLDLLIVLKTIQTMMSGFGSR
jgi:lipopolysaccharide/colanic/teichoic acid biosynthesis glycosyltransferase